MGKTAAILYRLTLGYFFTLKVFYTETNHHGDEIQSRFLLKA